MALTLAWRVWTWADDDDDDDDDATDSDSEDGGAPLAEHVRAQIVPWADWMDWMDLT